MKTETTYTFTEEDKKLLVKELPDDPCNKCSSDVRMSCCGCSARDRYDIAVKPYIDAGIYNIAKDIRRVRMLEKQKIEIDKEIELLKQDIPSFE